MLRAFLVVLAAQALLPACLTFTLSDFAEERAPRKAGVGALVEGESDLTQCLAALGAPLEVQELEDGAVLGWGWSQSRQWGVNLNIPLSRNRSGSLRYRRLGADVDGLVLFFDETWTLRRIRRGDLLDLLRTARARPNVVEEE